MSEKIVVPTLGESITEATVLKWLKNVGDEIEVDEAIVELETDKVNIEVPSPVKGILSEIKSDNGQIVEVGSELGIVELNGTSKLNPKKNRKEEPKNNSNEKKLEKETEKNLKVFEKKEKEIQDENISAEEPLILDEEKPLILSEEIEEINSTSTPLKKFINLGFLL